MAAILSGAQQATAPYEKLLDPTDGVWHPSVPSRIYRAYHETEREGWARWTKHLRRRKPRATAAEMAAGRRTELLWGVDVSDLTEETRSLIARLGKVQRGEKKIAADIPLRLAQWTHADPGAEASPTGLLMALAWRRALPRMATAVTAGLWWEAMNRMFGVASESSDANLWTRQLRAELRLALAFEYPELTACRELAAPGRSEAAATLAAALSPGAFPVADAWRLFPALLASWTRSLALCRRLKEGRWDKETDALYRHAVECAIRLSSADGALALVESSVDNRLTLKVARKLLGDQKPKRSSRATSGKKKASGGEHSGKGLASSAHCDETAAAILRSDWSSLAPRIVVRQRDHETLIELTAHRRALWRGRWETSVRFNGAPIAATGPCRKAFWVSDEEVDYLELHQTFEGGLRSERHLALARADRALLVADTFFAPEQGLIEYSTTLPLATGVAFDPAEETREGRLVAGRLVINVLPLALPEWRCDHRPGSLTASGDGLRLEQSSEGRGLFAAMLIDLKPKRGDRELTWRTLTVAEDRMATPVDVAVGYRAQIGERQWLVYRSLTGPANRSLLGQNVASELLFARFRTSGKLRRFVELETDEDAAAESS